MNIKLTYNRNVRSAATTQPKKEAAAAKTESTATPEAGDTVSLSKGTPTLGQTILNGSGQLLKAAGQGAGNVAIGVGKKVLSAATTFVGDTATAALAGAAPAAISALALTAAGPLAGLAAVATIGVGTGIAHSVLAPENPLDKGLSRQAKAHNRWVDSMVAGGLALCSGLVGMAPGGVALAGATAGIVGAGASVVGRSAEALGLLPPTEGPLFFGKTASA